MEKISDGDACPDYGLINIDLMFMPHELYGFSLLGTEFLGYSLRGLILGMNQGDKSLFP